MVDAAIGIRPTVRTSIRSLLGYALFAVLALHAVLLFVVPESQRNAASRLSTAAVPFLAAMCCLWRSQRVATRERQPWRMMSASLLLWAAGQVVETLVGQSSAAANLSVDAADFLYMTATVPLLLAVSNTRRTESIRFVLYLDGAQTALAFVLAYFRLYKMSMPDAEAATVMAKIYAAECAFVAFATILRLITWSTLEERRRVRLLSTVVWIFLPIELGIDYATPRWNLQGGTLVDLLWSVPFIFAGWQALHLPMDEAPASSQQRLSAGMLLVESLCPLLFTVAVFALAASIVSQHPILALSAILLLLLIQSLHAGAVQLSYVSVQHRLLEREHELKDANAELERMSLEDPLTGIPNRRRFTSALEDAWKRGLRRQEAVAVLMIDVDSFKAVNDLHGHLYGDECLQRVAGILGSQALRPDDLVARYGGEEFVVLLAEVEEAGALVVGERMRDAVYQAGLENGGSAFSRRLTVSVGAAACVPKVGMNPEDMLQMADRALYAAKRLGRNRVCGGSAKELPVA